MLGEEAGLETAAPPLPTTNIRDEGGLRLSSLIGSLIKMCLDFGCGLMVEHLSLSHPQQCGGAVKLVLASPETPCQNLG